MPDATTFARHSPHPAFLAQVPRPTDRGLAQLLRHKASGARVLWLEAETPEPVFTISFPTRPQDDRGAAHVLEHLIFRGSRRYPADPLYPALTEATMGSFLNASTRPDYTTFHAAAPTGCGLLPILQVVLDAVFNPKLDAQAFREEAWDLPEGAISARGVILSEMRDYMAHADNALALGLRAAILGGGDGAFNQGGDLTCLLQLTLQQVQDFHRESFNPGNAWITLYGGAAEALAQIDRALCEARERGGEVAPARAGAPLSDVTLTHGSGATRCGYAWRLPQDCPPELAVLLDSLLISGPEAVFRRLPGLIPGPATALVRDISQPYLTLAFADGEDAPLKQCVGDLLAGVSPDAVEVALSHALFIWYETDVSPRRPLGLQIFDPLIAPWLNGRDPFALLDAGGKLRALRDQPRDAQRLLQGLISQVFGRGAPESCVKLLPQAVEAGLSPPPPAGRALPFRPLLLSGAPPAIPEGLPEPEVETRGSVSLLSPEEDPLSRLKIAFVAEAGGGGGLASLATGLARDLTAERSLARVARGVGVWAGACGGQGVLWLQLTTLPEDFSTACDALVRTLSRGCLGAPEDPGPAMLARMISRPQSVIAARLRAGLSANSALHDALAGPGLVLQPRRPAQDLRLSGRVYLAASGTRGAALQGLSERLAALSHSAAPAVCGGMSAKGGDGFALPVPFHCVGLGFRSSQPAAARVLLRATEAAFLWPEIRGAGGAYGLRSEVDSEGEAVIFTARDPHLLRSLDVLRAAMGGIRGRLSPDVLERCRLGAAGQLLTPSGPQDLLEEVLRAQITGTSYRAAAKAELTHLRALTLAELHRAAEETEAALAEARPVIFGPEASLRAALAERPGLFTLHSDLQSPAPAQR
ncbi:insulinase family protein [Falsigemmobacter faecalis]|uniref:Uncharacterized protein n=1 Tax=Falsigemmobacter faecalis TaxID=2488730 RepID=A0A3P3DA29_9RHOB|nr:insulinase family protein [Falsigemmobacter faecalis]RRH70292.1 hypothetical protein EG244_17020 [Falsigemmobacter faecalis]